MSGAGFCPIIELYHFILRDFSVITVSCHDAGFPTVVLIQ